jgi:class 3 adenylate cyclase
MNEYSLTKETIPSDLYQARFENLFRVAKKVTSCLNIGDILEIIRDEVKVTVPHAQEACLILVDTDAVDYTRPLHCTVKKEQVNCHQCKRGREMVRKALDATNSFDCVLHDTGLGPLEFQGDLTAPCEAAIPIYDGKEPLAVLSILTKPGEFLNDRDMLLLSDLVELAGNILVNAKRYAKMAKEKLTVERILGHIRTFVPETVQRIVEKNPDAPLLEKRDVDVSVLFLDVADYTRISETFTQDKVNFIIEKYFSSFLDVIISYHGDVNETAGDGLMAIFQGTAEENAWNASQAALEIRSRTRKINKELEGLFYPVTVNMGINSGVVSLGVSKFTGGSWTRTTYTASGSATNLAARIAAAATEGDILIGPETAQRISRKTMIFDRGMMTFKNVKSGVHVFSLIPQEH